MTYKDILARQKEQEAQEAIDCLLQLHKNFLVKSLQRDDLPIGVRWALEQDLKETENAINSRAG